jgi:2-keto-3-deoxy-L-rhamnonate aldolase RhmA
MPDVLDRAAETTVVVAQVEDVAAVAEATAIAATPQLDAVFVGAADLAVALGERSIDAPPVAAACDEVISACRAVGRAVAAFATSPADAETWRARGAALVFYGTDQSRLRP